MYIQQGLYHASSHSQTNPWITPAEFNDYLSWPGDMHNFSGEAGASGVGNRFGGESKMRVGPSGATEDEDPNQVQNDDVGTERNKVIRGDRYFSCTMIRKLVLSFLFNFNFSINLV